jgi:hypothetical protein
MGGGLSCSIQRDGQIKHDEANSRSLQIGKTNTKDKDKYENNQRKISKSLLYMRHMCKVLGQFSGCCSHVLESLQSP